MTASPEDWDERYGGREYVWTVTVNRFIERELGHREPGTAIDLGAGEGRNAVWLAQRGWSVIAVDFSSVGLEKAARLAADHGVDVAFIHTDVFTYSPAEQVDLVVLAYLQVPDDQQRRVLARAASWLKPGGTVFVVAHDKSNVTDGHGGPPSADVCYDLPSTIAALDGLDIERAEVAERVVDTAEGPRTALDTLVVARRPDPTTSGRPQS